MEPNSREGLETGTVRSGFRSECRRAQDGQLQRDRCWVRSGRKPIRPPSDVIVGWQRREHGRKGPTPSGQGAWAEDLAINLGDQSEGTDETSPSWLDERPNSGALTFTSQTHWINRIGLRSRWRRFESCRGRQAKKPLQSWSRSPSWTAS
jgi:hypothetical protein